MLYNWEIEDGDIVPYSNMLNNIIYKEYWFLRGYDRHLIQWGYR